MQMGLRTLLAEIVDYTGLFPPANLALEEAAQSYARYRQEPEAWMLARLVCPGDRLNELAAPLEAAFTPDAPCPLAVVGREDPLSPEFIRDVRLLDQFVRTHGERARIEALEVRIREQTLAEWDPDVIAEGLNVLATRLVEHHFSDIEVFMEPLFAGDWCENVRQVVAALQRHDVEHGEPGPERIAFKLRTGGPEAAAFPAPEQVAFALVTCRDANIPLKFTAGLNEPLSHHEAGLGTLVFGFINVFAAGVLAQARGLDEPTLCALLREQDIAAFSFNETGFRWRDYEATIEEIETARDELVLSFGCYTFDGPCSGLRRLGLLP